MNITVNKRHFHKQQKCFDSQILRREKTVQNRKQFKRRQIPCVNWN